MADRETSFLTRWSRRKRDPDREPDPTAAPDKVDQGPDRVPAPRDDADIEEAAGDPEVIAKLPDIESLDETSDFAPFMAEGVPEILRRRALRKLWRLNPVFANLDGLNDYDEDFTDAATVLSELKTAYKVGKGMFDKEATEETAADTAGGTAAETSGASGAPEPEPAEPQPAESLEDGPALADVDADPSPQRTATDDTDQPVRVGEALGPPAEASEPGETVSREPVASPQRSAAAR
ncbi:MAG: DUF3306 domain-containing protein, partial [Kiloniellales bacterium]|nr:DUF3306 domain-containing protein [Kiloniellales bacterium]